MTELDPTNPEHVRLVREFIAEMAVSSLRSIAREASGWVYVIVDDENGKHVHAVGPFDTPEAALLASERQKAEDRRLNPGDPLWTHHVLPLFEEGK